ncbi:MAG: signal peptidase II [Solirubrobacterales bacterium]
MTSRAARAWCLAGALCGFVLIADQAAKAIAEAEIVPGEDVDVLGPFGFTLTHNDGVSWGLASGAGTPLVLISVLALGVVAYIFSRDPTRRGMWVAVGLLAGGALGNLADRVRVGAVTDFVVLPPWQPFNVADVAITFGVVLLVLIYLFDSRREPERADGT